MIGNSALTSRLYYDCERWPKLILCGHCHEGFGVVEMPEEGERGGCVVSNAATGVRLLEMR